MFTSPGSFIPDFPLVITSLFERAQCPLLTESERPPRFFVRYLRRKPGRGLVVSYMLDGAHASHKTPACDSRPLISLTLEEHILNRHSHSFNAAQVQQAFLEIHPSKVLRVPDLGLSVQVFPADESLPALATCCDMSPQSPLFEVLQQAAQIQLSNPAWRLLSVNAEPVRYKPASRCVIRYQLQLEHPQPGTGDTTRRLTIFGKVYANPEMARRVQSLQQQLYDEQMRTRAIPLLPRPLGLLNVPGLTLHEAVQPARENKDSVDEQAGIWGRLRSGTRALQPRMAREQGGVITRVILPVQELRLTAQALADLHNSNVRLDEHEPRTATAEAKRARERALLLADYYPGLAEKVLRLAQKLTSCLETLQSETYRPSHGAFKPSQLLFHSQHVFIVDFDAFCLADPALDVGYFLAYLRPGALWYRRPGMRSWFKAGVDIFHSAYHQAMLEHGVATTVIDGIFDRSQLYEAALIFKIATRRVHRLNSPRSQELAAMLDEIAAGLPP